MTITLEAIRAAGGIVHSDGNIFFRDISMLQGLAGAAPAAVAPKGEYPPLPEGVMFIEQIGGDVIARPTEYAYFKNARGVVHGAQLFTADQLRAYFDLGRQAAPALEAPAAPSEDLALVLAALEHGHPRARHSEVLAAARRLAAAPQAPAAPREFQQRVHPWLMVCFGPAISADKQERNHRFLEEALETVQAGGCTASEAHQLVDYVFGRPVGELGQEVGGAMTTLAALCLAHGIDMHTEAEKELARVWTMVEKIRAKQAAKPKHSPLPAAPAAPAVDAALNALIADVRALPTLRASEIDGEESDGTPKHWRNRPFVSLRKLELLLRDRVTASSDTALLNFIAAEYLDLRSFGMPTGQGDADVGWRVIQHHMGEPTERVMAEVYKDDPRSAIRAAIARLERDPYCTGALHEEDAAQATAKGAAS